MLEKLIATLKIPETQEIQNLDDSQNIYVLRKIIKRKTFLRNIYFSFYSTFLDVLQSVKVEGLVVELGSGAGFLKELVPYIITSDVIHYDGIDEVFSGLNMPFSDNTISSFLMIDVLHHIKDSRLFFKEMDRCLNIGGKIVMIEPANTIWSRFGSDPKVVEERG